MAPSRLPHEWERDRGRLRAHPRDVGDRDLHRGEPANAGRVGLAVLVTALVFWLSHVCARVLGIGVSEESSWGRTAVAYAMRHHWSLVEVVIPSS
jgi:hypothetical protein